MKMNLIMDTDSYKVSHYLQYPPNTTKIFSYIESRGGKYDETVFFGLQYLLKEYLAGAVVTAEMVEEAKEFYAAHGEPFNADGWMHIVNVHGGKLPVRIRAVAEGTVLPVSNVMMTIENTDPACYWLTSWLETMLLRVWYPITVATQSYNIKQLIRYWLEKTSDDPKGEIAFKLHDFGARGVSSQESAAWGGAAHLVNFMGSDTVVGVMHANKVYGVKGGMSAFSIPAAEHSSITSWGKDNEVEAYRNMLTKFGKPGALVAVVSDSYDLQNAVLNLWGGELKQAVIDSGAVVIIRPDSGEPADVVLETVQNLDKKFGHTVNKKGFKVLNNVRVIQGDGINQESINEILYNLVREGYSATNVAFGMGGALLQQVNRDTQRFAMKCSLAVVDGVEVEVFKDPVTDHGKKSKKGRLELVKIGGKFKTIQVLPNQSHGFGPSELVTVFENGEILKTYTFDEVRARAK